MPPPPFNGAAAAGRRRLQNARRDATAAVADTAMISLFRRDPTLEAARRAYQSVVEHARRPEFFRLCGVPDTLDGRFELICLHAFLYLRRLKREQPRSEALAQRFFDTMFGDLDNSLRELGTGDLSVSREIRRMAEAFYGRIQAYDDGLAGDDALLYPALVRNLFGTATEATAGVSAVAAYLRRAADHLDAQDAAPLLDGEVSFAPPPQEIPGLAADLQDGR